MAIRLVRGVRPLAVGAMLLFPVSSLMVLTSQSAAQVARVTPAIASVAEDPSAAPDRVVQTVSAPAVGGTVRREDGRVWVDGVDRLLWGVGRDSSFHGALATALKAAGRDLGYDYLLGASAAAFRVQLAQPEWCPSAPHAASGFDTTRAAVAAAGATLTVIAADEADAAAVERRRTAVVRSIDRGIPVLFLADECGLVVGYADEGRTILRKTYFDESDAPEAVEAWNGAAAGILDLADALPTRRASGTRSLELVGEINSTSTSGAYAVGLPALEAWVEQLADANRFAGADAETIEYAMRANAWGYTSLIDARAAAGRYLRSMAGEFRPRVSGRLMRAAELYEDLARKLAINRRHVPFPWDLGEGRTWTQAMRDAQARTLRQAMQTEEKAAEELADALEFIRLERPAPQLYRRPTQMGITRTTKAE